MRHSVVHARFGTYEEFAEFEEPIPNDVFCFTVENGFPVLRIGEGIRLFARLPFYPMSSTQEGPVE